MAKQTKAKVVAETEVSEMPVETTETTETQLTDDAEPATEPQAPVESEADDVLTHVEPPADTIDPVDERMQLAKQLNLTGRRNTMTGEPILPSTPAMRAAAAARARKTVTEDISLDIEKHVIEQYGAHVADDVNIKLVISTLSTYVKRMGPKSVIDEKSGGDMQAKLANLYDVVLSLRPEVAATALEIIVGVVKSNLQGAFSYTMALRFANTMPLNSELALRFQLLTTLFINLASGVSKKELASRMNVRQLLEYIPERDAKANLSEFIN